MTSVNQEKFSQCSSLNMDSVPQDSDIIRCSMLIVFGSAVDLSEKGTIVCCLGDCGHYLIVG